MSNYDLKFLVGTLVRIIATDEKAIVVGDYVSLCSFTNCSCGTDLSLALLDDDGEIVSIVSWFSLDKVELIPNSDQDHMECIGKLYDFFHRDLF